MLALEKVDDLMSNGRIKAVAEESPDVQQGLAVVMQIVIVAGDPVFINQSLPVVHDLIVQPFTGRTAQVITDCIDPSRLLSRLTDMAQHQIERRPAQIDEKSLRKDAVDSVFLHPFKVAFNRPLVRRTEECGGFRSGTAEPWNRVSFGRTVLRHLRPHLDRQ